MLRPGRNDPCRCGSGRKVKHCCGQERGPSDAQLARAHLAALAHDALDDLAGLPDDALDVLWEGLSDLPAVDLSLHVVLPRMLSPELSLALDSDDTDPLVAEVRALGDQIDTPQQRARLADALLALRDRRRVGRAQAAYAVYNLSSESRRFLHASVVAAVAVAVGASPTPAGLQIAA